MYKFIRIPPIFYILIAISTTLFGCGGGGSSSGGEQKDVTFCLSVEDIPSQILLFPRKEFTNTCDFPINLTIQSTGTSNGSLTTLAPNESHTSISVTGFNFIACRPPSTGFDSDDSFTVDLKCS